MAREYEIAKTAGQCRLCRRELAAGEEFVALLFDAGEDFRRDDFCPACWQRRGGEIQGYFSFWHGRMPLPQQPRKPVVDGQVLVDFLGKLAGCDQPAKINFRFVLALMLMRKKLLVYDGRATDQSGREVWKMHLRPVAGADRGEPVEVIRPELDEQKIAEVSQHLGDIFEVAS